MRKLQKIVYGTLIGLAGFGLLSNEAYSQQSPNNFLTNPSNPLYMAIVSDSKRVDSNKSYIKDSLKNKGMDSLAVKERDNKDKKLQRTIFSLWGSICVLAGVSYYLYKLNVRKRQS